MGIIDNIKKAVGLATVVPETKPKASKKLSAKELADKNKEPYVNILSMDISPDNLNEGSFDLDWNDIFVARLLKAGYQGKTDQDIVDQWFQNICRNIVLETYQQEQAMNPGMRTTKKDLGGGKTEVS
tara:strand:- start:83 stop:463 length:381 start_codon:yes stop_codon:yes gene_type:complete